MTDKEIMQDMDDAYRASEQYEKGIQEYNKALLKENGMTFKRIESLIDDCRIIGKMEIVSKPTGENQNEKRGWFTSVYVDQGSIGDTGDSYAGIIYGKISNDKWLAVPYEC